MKVYEIKTKIFLMKDLLSEEAQIEICRIIDTTLSKDEKWLEFHKKNEFKNYCFDSLYPIPKDKIYKSNQIYTFTLRTINENLASYFNQFLANEYNSTIKCLTSEIRIIPKKFIEKIYSITPAIIKDGSGYWKHNLSLKDFEFYTSLEFKNKKPCSFKYKDIKLLGDKISLNISDDKIAQDLAYMVLGTGILELNGRGAGFINYRWV